MSASRAMATGGLPVRRAVTREPATLAVASVETVVICFICAAIPALRGGTNPVASRSPPTCSRMTKERSQSGALSPAEILPPCGAMSEILSIAL